MTITNEANTILTQERLMKFYQVNTLEALVEVQAAHIERLQKKLAADATWLYRTKTPSRQG